MKRPPDLINLLAELADEKPSPAHGVTNDGKMIIVVEADESLRYPFTAQECRLLLSSTSSVERLHEALGCPDESHVELFDIELDHDVLEKLEEYFTTVDEV